MRRTRVGGSSPSPHLVHLSVVAPPAPADTPVPVGASSGLHFVATAAHPSDVVLELVSWPPLGYPASGEWL